MKKILLIIALVSLIVLAGCAQQKTEEPKISCDEYCESQPHIQCVGNWNISGTYPDCKCQFICSSGEAVY